MDVVLYFANGIHNKWHKWNKLFAYKIYIYSSPSTSSTIDLCNIYMVI